MTLPDLPPFVRGREELDGFTLYRTGGMAGRDQDVGCVVLVTIDTDDETTAKAWVDTVFTALASDPEPHPGGISAAFHIRDDGRRVINYAEWRSAEDHVEALGDGNGVGSPTADWRRVLTFPGVRQGGFVRYRPRTHAEVE